MKGREWITKNRRFRKLNRCSKPFPKSGSICCRRYGVFIKRAVKRLAKAVECPEHFHYLDPEIIGELSRVMVIPYA
jgi:hypothetical protein